MQKGLFLQGEKCCLRSWEAGDEETLAKLANNEKARLVYSLFEVFKENKCAKCSQR
jgi:hypothetical protein